MKKNKRLSMITLCMLLLLLSVSYAQTTSLRSAADILKITKTTPLVVIGNKVQSISMIDKLKSDDIFKLEILKPSDVSPYRASAKGRSIVMVTTTASVVKAYQAKLGAFSPDYKKYIVRDGDKGLLYTIATNDAPATPHKGGSLETTLKLMQLKSSAIKGVAVNTNAGPKGAQVTDVVIIMK